VHVVVRRLGFTSGVLLRSVLRRRFIARLLWRRLGFPVAVERLIARGGLAPAHAFRGGFFTIQVGPRRGAAFFMTYRRHALIDRRAPAIRFFIRSRRRHVFDKVL
jgi:hypothetical protein